MEQTIRMAPVAEGERVSAIDVLRGLALFGILTANMRGFFSPGGAYFNVSALYPGQADVLAQNIVNYVFQGKFITLFSILFGIGFAIQMDRARKKGSSDVFYLRRLALLLVFGLLHAWLIWWGDILAPYAVTGFLLYFLFQNRQQITLLIWAGIGFCAPFVLQIGGLVYQAISGNTPPSGPPTSDNKALLESVRIYSTGSYWAVTQHRFHEWLQFNRFPIFLFTLVLPRFLFGLWVWRSGLLTSLQDNRDLLMKVLRWSIVVALACDAMLLTLQFVFPQKGFTPLSLLTNVGRQVSIVATALLYGSGVFLLLRSAPWRARLEPFAAVGRMALTNYLLQSLICTWFFRLTGLYGKIGPAWGFVPTILLFSLQISFSVWWLKHYRFGAVEWLWRSLTYGSMQPMRRIAPPDGAIAANV